MKREIYKKLLDWKNKKQRKPLILQGARQVGKTYIIKEFGNKEYNNFYYFNFEQNKNLESLFNEDLNPNNIIENLSIYIGEKIKSENTLIFFDEIQVAEKVLTSLKYFQEQANEFHIVAAGSLLGVSVAKASSFPVGKVNFMKMYPMNFYEFLMAIDEELLLEKIKNLNFEDTLAEPIHEKLLKYFKIYLFTGGMPEVVKTYIEEKDFTLTRDIQIEILEAYKRDFSKYTDKKQTIKTSELWQSIPYQLAKENKKFKYSDVKKNARALTFEQTIQWLKDAGLIHLAYNISTPKIPLSAYSDYSKFKIYLLDTGLLAAMLNISAKMILEPEKIFKEFNGAFIENFVAQELSSSNLSPLFYWTSKSDAEVDFILELNDNIYPLEVKSGTSLNTKSLQSYNAKYKPKLLFRTSPRNLIKRENFINIPIYMVKNLLEN